MANDYTKLAGGAGSGRLATSQFSLWLGPDHLLQIEKQGHTEKYHRFYFKDIESVTIRRTNRQRNYGLFFGILLALFLWMLIMVGGGARFVTGGFMVLFAIPFIVNLVKGPTCVTHLTTAVQSREIHSLRRVRGAERALDEILNGSHAAQGLLSAEETRLRFQLSMAPPPLSPPPIASPVFPSPEELSQPRPPTEQPPPPV
jgi:hypothetical protein